MNPTSEEIKAAAESATSARQAANEFKSKADAAGGTDEALNSAFAEADSKAREAEQASISLSQNAKPQSSEEKTKKVQKLQRARHFIDKDLRELGVEPDEPAAGEEDDLDKPLTLRHLEERERTNATKSAQQMAQAVADPLDRQAVTEALKDVVPSGNAEADFKKAVAIANIARNSKILEEIQRKPIPRTTATGSGAPAPVTEEFVPDENEKLAMARFGLTETDIKNSRIQAAGKK